jgi:hypothetical protein
MQIREMFGPVRFNHVYGRSLEEFDLKSTPNIVIKCPSDASVEIINAPLNEFRFIASVFNKKSNKAPLAGLENVSAPNFLFEPGCNVKSSKEHSQMRFLCWRSCIRGERCSKDRN